MSVCSLIFICLYVGIFVCMCVCGVYVFLCEYLSVCVCMFWVMCLFSCVSEWRNMYGCMHVSVDCGSVYVRVSLCVCVCVCDYFLCFSVYIFMYIYVYMCVRFCLYVW